MNNFIIYSLFGAISIIVSTATAQPASPTMLGTIEAQSASLLDKHADRFVPTNKSLNSLGDAVKQISGVQSNSFGPSVGAPIIRSLSGNRVKILQDHIGFYGAHQFNGASTLAFDPLFSEEIQVSKTQHTVRYGGQAIGGVVNIDSGLIPKQIGEKAFSAEMVAKKGFNATDNVGVKLNINNQKNVSANFIFSRQHIDHYRIPGHSKASECSRHLFSTNQNGTGINSAVEGACQRHAVINKEFNFKTRPYYIKDYVQSMDADHVVFNDTYKEYGLYPNDVFFHTPGAGRIANPLYDPKATEAISTDFGEITPNYHKTLGNSRLTNQRIALGTRYFFDRGWVSVGADFFNSRYGLPGFNMQRLTQYQSYELAKPVSVEMQQRLFFVEGEYQFPETTLNAVQFMLAHQQQQSAEFLGAEKANHYHLKSYQAEITLPHRWNNHINGMLGLHLEHQNILSSGKEPYLPNSQKQSHAFFIEQSAQFKHIDIDAGYRIDHIAYQPQQHGFVLNRNSPNYPQLEKRQFRLHHYFLSHTLKWNENVGLRLSYAIAERAPEVNELYASNYHYSMMMHEEGNQHLRPEKTKSLEARFYLHNDDFNFSTAWYRLDFKNYLYLGHSGIITARRLPLKYWQQTDTRIEGIEMDIRKTFNLSGYGQLNISAFADFVRNKAIRLSALRAHNEGVYLPNMPTNRYGLGIEWLHNGWEIGVQGIHYAKPRYIGKSVSEEPALPAYTLLDLHLQKDISLEGFDAELFLSVSNLLNQEARPYTSPLKYIAPLPGRAFQAGFRLRY